MALKEHKIYPKWKAEVRGGRLYFEDEGAFYNHLIPYEGKKINVIVKHQFKDRSRQEEKFYHAVVVRMIAEAMSVSDQYAHDFLRSLFLTAEESLVVNGNRIRYTRTLSTTELSDKAYREYWEDCIKWASLPTNPSGLNQDSGLELYIPMPNEVDFTNY